MLLFTKIIRSATGTRIIKSVFPPQWRKCQTFLQDSGVFPTLIQSAGYSFLETVLGTKKGTKVIFLIETTPFVLSHTRLYKKMPVSISLFGTNTTVKTCRLSNQRPYIFTCPCFIIHVKRSFVSHSSHIARIVYLVIKFVWRCRIVIALKVSIRKYPRRKNSIYFQQSLCIGFHSVYPLGKIFYP